MTQLTDDCFAADEAFLPLKEAVERLLQKIGPVCPVETLPLQDAAGRVLAADVVSPVDVPSYDNSAVDGYAVYFDDLSADGETRLPVVGRVAAGHPLDAPMRRGQAVRIFTGAPIPAGEDGGPDTIMMQEDCRVEGDEVILLPGIRQGANYRRTGEDVVAGGSVLTAGQRLAPQDIGMAASTGAAELQVYAPLRVAVVSSGDEVVEPGNAAPEGMLYDSNRHMLQAVLRRMGCAVSDLGILRDSHDEITTRLREAAESHDVIVTSGGMSVGEEDHMKSAVEELGAMNFWRLSIKPGRPVGLGRIADSSGRNVPLLGLPGNPVAAMTTFLLLGRPLVTVLGGENYTEPRRLKALAGFDYVKKEGRREFVRIRLSNGKAGLPTAEKHGRGGAAMLSSLVGADGFLELPEQVTQIDEGDLVEVLPFNEVM